MSALVTTLVEALQDQLPEFPLVELTAAVESVLAGTAARLDTNQLRIVFGDHATLTNCTIAVGNTTVAVTLPEPPDSLKIALAHYASMPLDTVPAVRSIDLPAGSHMPFFALHTFVGRTDELRELAHALSESRTAALVPAIAQGIMGVGKTSLALEFAHRYGYYFQGGVFWIDCAEAANVPSNIAQCGVSMGLYPIITELDAAVALVQQAWKQPIPRLLIFDNCEDPQIVTHYAPKGGGSRVLVTARRQQWATWPLVHVGSLLRKDSLLLLQQLVPRVTIEEAHQLADFVGDLPLGLRLIGSYLGYYNMNVSAYLEQLDVTHRSFEGRGIQIPDTEMPGRIEINLRTIISLAVKDLEGNHPTKILARHILDIFCHVAPNEPIPETLMISCLTNPIPYDDIVDARAWLLNLGLLESRDGMQTSIFHGLIQKLLITTHATVQTCEDLKFYLGSELSKLSKTGQPFSSEWIIIHASWIIKNTKNNSIYTAATGFLANNLGYLYALQGRYNDSRSILEYSLELSSKVFGINHQETAIVLNNLALIYKEQGQYQKSIEYYQKVLKIQEKIFDKKSTVILDTLNNLGEALYGLCEYQEAENIHKQVLNGRIEQLDPESPDIAQSFNNLANTYIIQGKYNLAIQLYQKALSINTARLGENHFLTATNLHNLGGLYYKLNEYNQSELFFKKALDICRLVLGDNHPDTLQTMNELMLVYITQEKYNEAKMLYNQLIRVEFDIEISPVLISDIFNNLGLFCEKTLNYDEGIVMYKKSLSIREKILQPNHINIAQSLNNIAGIYVMQKLYNQAELYYKKAISIYEEVHGQLHISVAISIYNLGVLYFHKNEYQKSYIECKKATDLAIKILGINHLDTQNMINGLEAIKNYF